MLKHIMGSNLKELESEFNNLKNVKIITINVIGMNYIIHFEEIKNVKNLERRKSKSS